MTDQQKAALSATTLVILVMIWCWIKAYFFNELSMTSSIFVGASCGLISFNYAELIDKHLRFRQLRKDYDEYIEKKLKAFKISTDRNVLKSKREAK